MNKERETKNILGLPLFLRIYRKSGLLALERAEDSLHIVLIVRSVKKID